MDHNVEKQFEQLQRKTRLASVFGIITVIGLMMFFFAMASIGSGSDLAGDGLIGVALVILVIGGPMAFKLRKAGQELKEFQGEHIVRAVLEEKIDVKSYSPNGHISSDKVSRSRLYSSWTSISGSDLTIGTYKGIPIEFSDLLLTHETSDGDGGTNTVTDFKGQFLILQYNKSIPGRVAVVERGSLGKKGLFRHGGKNIVQLENEEFNRHFSVAATNEQDAFYLLTPQFMETIEKMDRMADAKTSMIFDADTVTIGLYNRKNLFERGKTIQENIRYCRKDMQYLTDILDILIENTYLFQAKSEEVSNAEA